MCLGIDHAEMRDDCIHADGTLLGISVNAQLVVWLPL